MLRILNSFIKYKVDGLKSKEVQGGVEGGGGGKGGGKGGVSDDVLFVEK